MMLIDRYIARSIAWSSLFVTLILLTLFVFIDFIGELGDAGKGDYGVVHALIYVVLTLPALLYQLFPVLALLGTLVGLALLANHGELMAIRAAGVSLWRILGSVSMIGLVFVVLSFVVGEWVAPKSGVFAEQYKSRLQSGDASLTKTKSGYWLRKKNNFIYVEGIADDGKPGGVDIWTIDDETLALTRSLHAEIAVPLAQGWQFNNVDTINLSMAGIERQNVRVMQWDDFPEQSLLIAASTKPEELSAYELFRYVSYLHNNGLQALAYEQTLYSKIVAPLTVAVMVLLAFPFVFGSLRSAGIGHYVFIGACIGIGFHLFNELFRYSGLVYGLPPLFSALAPTALFFVIAIISVRRIF
ncbi:MAG: LPS export ABC transporter permease LptG [Gammaproteobacteria bacterium]|nr:LPS export ABC transporter permease LptG [Beggiatoa alba]PCH60943.1 MAG: LPS export ABC transporter permease LptG [Gammaproteobacteria bacterium]